MYQYNPILLCETRYGYLGKLTKHGAFRDGIASGLRKTRKGYDRPILIGLAAVPVPTGVGVLAAVPNSTRARLYRDLMDTPGKTIVKGVKGIPKAIKKIPGEIKKIPSETKDMAKKIKKWLIAQKES